MISEHSVQLLQLHTRLPANCCCFSESLRLREFEFVYSMLVAIGFCAVGSCRCKLCAFWKFSSIYSALNRLRVFEFCSLVGCYRCSLRDSAEQRSSVLLSAVTAARCVIAQNSAVLFSCRLLPLRDSAEQCSSVLLSAVTAACCVIAQNSAVFIYYAMED